MYMMEKTVPYLFLLKAVSYIASALLEKLIHNSYNKLSILVLKVKLLYIFTAIELEVHLINQLYHIGHHNKLSKSEVSHIHHKLNAGILRCNILDNHVIVLYEALNKLILLITERSGTCQKVIHHTSKQIHCLPL